MYLTINQAPHLYNNCAFLIHEKPLYENKPLPIEDNDLD